MSVSFLCDLSCSAHMQSIYTDYGIFSTNNIDNDKERYLKRKKAIFINFLFLLIHDVWSQSISIFPNTELGINL